MASKIAYVSQIGTNGWVSDPIISSVTEICLSSLVNSSPVTCMPGYTGSGDLLCMHTGRGDCSTSGRCSRLGMASPPTCLPTLTQLQVSIRQWFSCDVYVLDTSSAKPACELPSTSDLINDFANHGTGRPSLKEVYADYLKELPRYRGIPDLAGVSCVRPFFGFVPNWNDTPLKPMTSRLLHVGDSAGNRSALSFAGRILALHPSTHPLLLCLDDLDLTWFYTIGSILFLTTYPCSHHSSDEYLCVIPSERVEKLALLSRGPRITMLRSTVGMVRRPPVMRFFTD